MVEEFYKNFNRHFAFVTTTVCKKQIKTYAYYIFIAKNKNEFRWLQSNEYYTIIILKG